MCYSAEAWQDYRLYVEEFGADLSIQDFVDLYGNRGRKAKVRTAKGMDDALAADTSPRLQEIRDLIATGRDLEEARLHQEIAKQRARRDAANAALAKKTTATAAKELDVSTRMLGAAEFKLQEVRRRDGSDRDSRIYPGTYGLLMTSEGGRRLVRPMRYQCRPAGVPAEYDRKYPGTYNARRSSLGGFWKRQFGHTHGIMVVKAFYEHVAGPAGNQVLRFQPRTAEPMLVACLWSKWSDPAGIEPDLLSFAAITDEPEPEVAQAGHDRTIINIRPENIDAWLNPQGRSQAELESILEEKQHPFYEHAIAA